MKKLFSIVAISAILFSCNETETTTSTESDSARAAAVADSIQAANAMKVDTTMSADTAMKPMADTTTMKADSIK